MNFQSMHAGPSYSFSFTVVGYSLLQCSTKAAEIYLDRLGAVSLSRRIHELQNAPLFFSDDQYIAHLTPRILTHIKTKRGKDLYRVHIVTLQQSIRQADLEWKVIYQDGESYKTIEREINEYLHESSQIFQEYLLASPIMMEHSFALSPHANMSPRHLNLLPQIMPSPLQNTAVNSFQESMTTFNTARSEILPGVSHSQRTETTLHASSPVQEPQIESGCTTPVDRGALNEVLDVMITEMNQHNGEAQTNDDPHMDTQLRPAPHNPFKSEFAKAEEQAVIDKKAALFIISKMKVLAVNTHKDRSIPHQFSISREIHAIKTMSLNTSLNIGNSDWTTSEKLERLFKAYDTNDEEGKESFHRGLLMIAVRLMRHQFMYETKGGKKQPGNFATDFDKLYKFPTGYIQKAKDLCRILVACGHPCVLVVLVRLAIRNQVTLGALLDSLPMEHFCRFVSSGKVTDMSFSEEDQDTTHSDLKWLHHNVFLPLLQAASRRVSDQLFLVNGSLTCDMKSCLRAIVHHSKQVKYSQYLARNLAGDRDEAEWARGKVALDVAKGTPKQYSIEEKQRTVLFFDLTKSSDIEHFQDPPTFLKSRVLPMTEDV
jgi:hypothetical protein